MRGTIVAALALAALGCATSAGAAPVATTSDYDCGDFSTQEEAQEYLEPGDPYRLDADNLVAHLLPSDRVRVEARELECVLLPTG